MKKFIGFVVLFIIVMQVSFGQHGLENIIVEKYYVSDKSDSKAKSGGYLPKGSVTYRIYVDLKKGYRLQAVYGIQGHELRIATTTWFFNNEEFGASTANDIHYSSLGKNTVMLDSWLSVGAGAQGYYGVLKSEDDTLKTIINSEQRKLLQNDDSSAGIPIKIRDGLKPASPIAVVSTFGIDKEIELFNNRNRKDIPNVFSTTNGSWASFGGAIGPDDNNKVLIAQLTTNGVLSFELNLQLGTPDGKIENYVARNPENNQVLMDCLKYSSEKNQVQ